MQSLLLSSVSPVLSVLFSPRLLCSGAANIKDPQPCLSLIPLALAWVSLTGIYGTEKKEHLEHNRCQIIFEGFSLFHRFLQRPTYYILLYSPLHWFNICKTFSRLNLYLSTKVCTYFPVHKHALRWTLANPNKKALNIYLHMYTIHPSLLVTQALSVLSVNQFLTCRNHLSNITHQSRSLSSFEDQGSYRCALYRVGVITACRGALPQRNVVYRRREEWNKVDSGEMQPDTLGYCGSLNCINDITFHFNEEEAEEKSLHFHCII